MNLHVIITFIIYTAVIFILTYYFNLFASKTEYTRSEFSNILPQIGQMFRKLYTNYSIPVLTVILLLSAFIGVIIPAYLTNWLINSALLCVIIYFTIPKLATYFEETRVTISDSYVDNLQVAFVRYYQFIIIGFNSGYATTLIINWAVKDVITFIWLMINLSIITLISILVLRDNIFHNL